MISDTVICTVNEYSFSIFVALNYNNAWWQGHIIQLFELWKQKMQLIVTSLLSHFCYSNDIVGNFYDIETALSSHKIWNSTFEFSPSFWLFSGQRSTWWSSSTVLRAFKIHLKGGISHKGRDEENEEKFYARFELPSITPFLSGKLRCSLINKFCHFTCGSTTFWRGKSDYANISDT